MDRDSDVHRARVREQDRPSPYPLNPSRSSSASANPDLIKHSSFEARTMSPSKREAITSASSASNSLALSNLVHASSATSSSLSAISRKASWFSPSPPRQVKASRQDDDIPIAGPSTRPHVEATGSGSGSARPRTRRALSSRSRTSIPPLTTSVPQARDRDPSAQVSEHDPRARPHRTLSQTPLLPPPFDPYRAAPVSTSSWISVPPPQSSHPHHAPAARHAPEAWFAIGDPPLRNRAGWSREKQDGYAAGWEDALRSVEAGLIGIGGHQYHRPVLVRKDIPQPEMPFNQGSYPHRADLPKTGGHHPALPPPSHERPGSRDTNIFRHWDPGPSAGPTWAYSAGSPNQPTTERPRTHGHGSSHRRRSSFNAQQRTPPPTRPGPSTASSSLAPPAIHSAPLPPYYAHAAAAMPPIRPYSRDRPLTATSIPFSRSQSPTSPASTASWQGHGDRHSAGRRERDKDRRNRQIISCFPCRSRKLKCNGQRPCSQCIRRGDNDSCEYAKSVRRRGKGKRPRGKGSGVEEQSDDNEEGERVKDEEEEEEAEPESNRDCQVASGSRQPREPDGIETGSPA